MVTDVYVRALKVEKPEVERRKRYSNFFRVPSHACFVSFIMCKMYSTHDLFAVQLVVSMYTVQS